MLRRLALVLPFMISLPAWAADPSGVWVFSAENTAVFKLEITRTATGWSGVWVRPHTMNSNGETFYNLALPLERRTASAAKAVADGVELTFPDPRPGSSPDVIRVVASDETHAQAIRPDDSDPLPMPLTRDTGQAMGPWDPAHTYNAPPPIWLDNPEMAAIYAADQGEREALIKDGLIYKQTPEAKAAQEAVWLADERRYARTKELLAAGALQSGSDLQKAAFIFQHGDKSDDYLLAHILAIAAMARGNTGARWIAAATLDRYLYAVNQPQVLGTQTFFAEGTTTQDPYDTALISDSLRKILKVPPLEEQRRKLEQTRSERAQAQTAKEGGK